MMSRLLMLALFAGIAVPASSQDQLPIIDMHMHARITAIRGADNQPVPPICIPVGCVPYPTIVRSDEDVMNLALEAMERRHIVLGVVSDMNLEDVYQWSDARKGQFLAGPVVFEPAWADTARIRRDLASGRLQVMGEIATQYQGYPPHDVANEPFFALAEEYDVPVLIHTSGAAAPNKTFRIHDGHPDRLEEVLLLHPKLRLWLENAAYPFLDEVIALMYRYPQVYVDVSTITWVIPRAEFWRYLEALMTAGLGNRIMWGSDQMNWPGMIEQGLSAIEEAPFLTDEQKRDILYNNAARFLRLSDAEVAKHHGK